MILKTITAVIAKFVIVITCPAVAAVMLFIAGSTGALPAVVTVVAFPVVVTPCSTVVTLDAIFIRRRDGNRKQSQKFV